MYVRRYLCTYAYRGAYLTEPERAVGNMDCKIPEQFSKASSCGFYFVVESGKSSENLPPYINIL